MAFSTTFVTSRIAQIVVGIMLIFSSAGICSCTRKNDWSDAAFKSAYIKERRSVAYSFDSPALALESALVLLANDVAMGKNQSAALVSEREFVENYWPNLPDIYTQGPANNPPSAWLLESQMRSLAMGRMQALLAGATDWRVRKIEMRAPSEMFHSLKVYYPRFIVFTSDALQREAYVDSIGVVIEYRGVYEIARLGPNYGD